MQDGIQDIEEAIQVILRNPNVRVVVDPNLIHILAHRAPSKAVSVGGSLLLGRELFSLMVTFHF